MWGLSRAVPRLRDTIGLYDVLLLGWFSLYLLFFVQPHLVYQASAPPFSLVPGFADPFLHTSGGLTGYAACFLAQFDAWGWPGVVIRIVEALGIGILSDACLRRVVGRPVRFLRLVPMALYMLQCGQYDQSPMGGLTLMVMLAAVLLFGAAGFRRVGMRLGAYLLATVGVYYGAAGSQGKLCLLLTLATFVLLCAAVEARRGWGKGAGIACGVVLLALAAAVAGLGERYFLTGDIAGWASWRTVSWTWAHLLQILLLLSLPLCAAAAALGGWVAGRWRARRAGGAGAPAAEEEEAPAGEAAEPPVGDAPKRPARSALWSLLGAAACAWGVSLLATNVTVDTAGRNRAQIDYLVMNGKWDQVLEAAMALPPEERSLLTYHDIDTALYHTGRLSEQLLAFDQPAGGMFLPMVKSPILGYRLRLADQYLELGRVNCAERALHEALPVWGEDPQLLRRLALVYMAKGQIPAARLYLNRLRYNLVHRRWAQDTLGLLDRDPGLTSDARIQHLRQVMLTYDDLTEISDIENGKEETFYFPDRIFRSMAQRDPHNRMAVEYLINLYLLVGRPDLAAEELPRAEGLIGRRLPRAWEEALLLYMEESGRKVNLGGRSISQATLERYVRFRQIFAAAGYDMRRAYPEVAKRCPGTYYAYALRMRVAQ